MAGRRRSFRNGHTDTRSRSPVRCKRNFGSHAERPAGLGMQNLVLVYHKAGVFKEARPRPRQSPSSVDQPMIERAAQSCAQRGDIIDFCGEGGAGRCWLGRDHAVLQEVWKSNVSFKSKHQPGWRHVIVAEVESAIEATK